MSRKPESRQTGAGPAGIPPEASLGALQEYFAGRLPERLREIEEAWTAVRDSAWNEEPLRFFHRLAHSLTGAGATFGFPMVTRASRSLEQLLKTVIQGAPPPADAGVEVLLRRLRRAAHRPATPASRPPDPSPDPQEAFFSPDGRLILLVEDDPELGESLRVQLQRFGYGVRLLDHPDSLEEEMDSELPCAVVLDMVLPEGRLAGAETIERLHQWRREGVKVICLSSRGDLEARLAAVRAGCEAYFVKPVDAGALVERLDLLTARPEEPYRVLIVDDDAELAGYYAGALQGAGMLAVPLSDPMRVMEPLTTLRPDLILMDMYMQGCSGPELAAALRQQEGYLSTPIIFLSTEESMDEQLAALSLGGDEFLTKPIDPRHLVAAVTARAQRGRLLGSLIAYDSLTGLLNHGTLKQHLENELSRASRESLPVAYAMIDVDRFKLINDTYGHAAGDRLLRNLAFFLKQRLRRSDVIGRYGGDEIAVVLPHTDGPTAHRVLEEIRESFTHLRHRFGTDEATATFTCGISVYPACTNAERLVEAADQALYTGKRAGKNRVVLTP